MAADNDPSTDHPKPITRDDLEAGFRQLTGEVDERAESARDTIITAAAVGAAVVIGIVFLLGVRRGKRKTTIVEVRRF